MAKITSINPGDVARQFRDEALRKAEDTYIADVKNASAARDKSIADANAEKDSALKSARKSLELCKKRIAEALDKEDKRQRKHEEKAERTIQEQRVIKAENDRVRTIVRAAAIYKNQTAEADKNRKRAIHQVGEDEKRIKLEAGEAAKKQKETARIADKAGRKVAGTSRQEIVPPEIQPSRQTRGNEKRIKLEADEAAKKQKQAERLAAEAERKAALVAEHEAAMARINTIKAAAQKALDEKRMKLEAEEAVKKQKADALIAAESERKAAKAAEQEAGLARIKAQKAAEQEVMDNKKLAAQKLADEKRIKLEAEEAAKKQKEAARLAADEERKAFKAAKATEHESAQAKIRAQKLEAAVPTLAKGDPPGGKPLPNEEEKNAVDAVTASAVKQGKKGASVNREGMIKLNILNGSSDATHVATFEKSLREIPGIKVIMISGDNKEGVQIIVSSEDSVALSEILRQMPIVKEVADRQSDIMIRLQPLTVFKEL